MTEATVNIDGVEFNFSLMAVKDMLEVESMIGSYIMQSKGGTPDHSTIYQIAKKVLHGALVDGHDLDFDTYFRGKLVLLHKAMLEGLKANAVDFLELLQSKGVSLDSALKKANLSL